MLSLMSHGDLGKLATLPFRKEFRKTLNANSPVHVTGMVFLLFSLEYFSGKFVRLACIFGIEDAPQLSKAHYLFANKFYLNFEYLAMDCLEEYLWNRTWKPVNFNANYYQRIASKYKNG